MIDYVIKVIMLQVLFLLLYDLFLSRETFFHKNRVYLLTTFISSFVLPLITIPAFKKMASDGISMTLPEIVLSPQELLGQTFLFQSSANSVSYSTVIFWIGVLIFSMLFLAKLLKISTLIKGNLLLKEKGYSIISLPESRKAFSFLNYIFLGEKIVEDEREKVIAHELVHLKQRHSLDLLLFEVFKILMWFNPLTYFYQKRIELVHEYLSDSSVITSDKKNTYINKLLSDLFDVENIAFINQFYKYSSIKKRIIMIKKVKSSPVRQIKYLLILPLLICTLFYNATTVNTPKKDAKVLKNNSALKSLDTITNTTEAVPFAKIEEVPVFPGCEGTEKEKRKCFSKKTQKHFIANFDSSLPKKLKLPAGKKRMIMQFKVDKNGKVSEVFAKGPHAELEKEAVRILKLLPDMKPGKQDGKNVAVKYTLPLRIDVD